jgi:S-adenosyl-L-methionine hydrolase (adenosine-forming)
MGIVTLLSDFGLGDVYVGVMKGAIAQVNPAITVIDLTHQIPPQDIAAARFALSNAVPYFPTGTVHVAVVDPGVGSDRRSVAVAIAPPQSPDPVAVIVAPDNGLLSDVMQHYRVVAAVELTNPRYWRVAQPSATFHGRDLFAPVAAHVASGVAIAHLGQAIAPDSLVKCEIPGYTQMGAALVGSIQTADQFGNLITTLPATAISYANWSVQLVPALAPTQVEVVAPLWVPGCRTYSDRPRGEWVALIGSHGWVELAVNQGNAMQQLNSLGVRFTGLQVRLMQQGEPE